MTSKLLAGLGSVLLLAACQASPGQESNHWNIESLAPRTAKAFLGYRRDLDGTYREFQWRQKQDINLTLRRHFLNDSPTNVVSSQS
jgi:outer membrane biogenesis lipoprotein LolB